MKYLLNIYSRRNGLSFSNYNKNNNYKTKMDFKYNKK